MSLGSVATLAQPCLLQHLCRVWRVLRVWWQGRWLDIHGREFLRSKRLICGASKAHEHNDMCDGNRRLAFVELPTTEPVLRDSCTLRWACQPA